MQNNQLLPAQIFREYDIRGLIDSELSIKEVYDLGLAIVYFFKQHDPQVKKIALAMDGRTHSGLIKEELARAIQASGCDVIFLGVCHSPALYFAMHTMPVDAGLMITASHNPKEYNGLKICLGKQSIWGKAIQEIYQLYTQRKRIITESIGSYQEQEIIEPYTDWLAEHFKHLQGASVPAVIDCGNGAGGAILPSLIKKMRWTDLKVLYVEVDGTFPHHEADPVNIHNMQEVKRLLEEGSYAFGAGLDGDADRMAAMTKQGYLVPGDLLLGLFAKPIIATHPDAAVVSDIKSSGALITYLEQLGARSIISPSGHSIIKHEMKKQHALLGGELSCHFFFHDRYFGYDDGVYAFMRLVELLQHTDLQTLLEVYPRTWTSPELRIFCPDNKKKLVVQTVSDIFAQKHDARLLTIDGVRVTMPYGWGLLRASNTQPALSMRFEAQNQEGLREIKQAFMQALAPFYKQDDLALLSVGESV